MFEDLHSTIVRVRIASLQSEVLARSPPRNQHTIVRHRTSKVTPLVSPSGSVKLGKTRVIRARRHVSP
jgi:hypothetical protein